MNVYESFPVLENEKFLLRKIAANDVKALCRVYGDEKAALFFNSDNCHGDDFRYTSEERVRQAVDFWDSAYRNGWFVRWAIVDKATGEAIGTAEEFLRKADDFFTDCGLIRLDLRSDYEDAEKIGQILSPLVAASFGLFGCDKLATKAIPAAAKRQAALLRLGFSPSDEALVGDDGTRYGDYFVLSKNFRF